MSLTVKDQLESTPQETCVQNGQITSPTDHSDKVSDRVESAGDNLHGDSVVVSKDVQYSIDREKQSNDGQDNTETCERVSNLMEENSESSQGEGRSNENHEASIQSVSPQEDLESETSPSDGKHYSEQNQTVNPEESTSQEVADKGMSHSDETHESVDSHTPNPDKYTTREDVENQISPVEVSENDAVNKIISLDKNMSQEDLSIEISTSDGVCISEEVAKSQGLSPGKATSQDSVELKKSSDGIHISVDDGNIQTLSSDKGTAENDVETEKSLDGVPISSSQTHSPDKSSSQEDIQVLNNPSDKTHVSDAASSRPEKSQNAESSNTSQNIDDRNTEAHDDEDEDIIVVSETPKNVNKKSNLTTLFKCVRCGQISKSRSELNVHLLQVHKLIIVSKQKSVDCIFCTKSMEMSKFYQHLRTEHKVLLVKSKGQTSSGDKSVGEKDTSEKTQPQLKISSSEGLIDLTAEEEGESSKSSDKPEKHTGVSKDNSTSHSLPSTSKETSMALRRTPRKVTQRKYTEVNTESSSSDDNEPVDACDDDDDDDYDPHMPEYPRGKQSKSPLQTKARQVITKNAVQSGKKTISLHVTSTKAQSSTTGNITISKPGHPATDVTKTVALAVNGSSGLTLATTAVGGTSVATVQKSVGTLDKLSPNQIVKLNGSLYTVYQSGTNKYLIPLNTTNATAQETSTVRSNTHVIANQGITTQGLSTVQLASSQTIGSGGVNTPGISTLGISAPHITTPVAVSQLAIPQVPHLATGVGNLPLQPVTANVLSGPQGNILQAGVVQQPVIFSTPTVQPLQTFLVTVPQKPVSIEGNVNTSILLNGVQSNAQSIVTSQAFSLPVAQKNPASGQTKSTSAIDTQAGNSALTLGLNNRNTNVQFSSTKPSASATSKPTSLPTKKIAPATQPTPTAIHVAKPHDVKSSDLHKTGGLFALEVCLDTATHLGTEPMPETIVTYILQEKETVFVEPTKDDNTQDVETERTLSDAEKCKVVIATAISRGHLTPNDLTSINSDVYFECTRCNSCFPQHIQLNLHMKQCSQLPPSSIPKIKIHSPVSVIDEFYKDPTGGRNFLYMYCRFCRARIVRNQHDHSLLISHLLKHIEPKVELAILPKKQKGTHHVSSPSDCTAKSLEWVDYIVPPFTLDNPPTSAKNGSLDMYTSTQDPALLSLSKKKKKKKKKKKHKYRDSDSDEDYGKLAGSRLSSLRPKNGRYIGTLRPKETTPQQPVSSNGVGSVGSNIDPSGTKPRGGRTMMQSFKHICSPNKRGSTLTACIPMKSKYRDKERPGESTRRWNNGKTRSQLHVHWRRSSRRFSHLRDRDASTPDDSTPEGSVDCIQLSSDEDENQGLEETHTSEGIGTFHDAMEPSMSNSPVTITEDDISDYVKIIDEAEELQVSPKATLSSSSTANDAKGQEDSDLVDYYGNDVNSTLSCEPLIMEPEQVICYFKKCSGNLMECQFRSCGSRVLKNIRAMLGHIRVHFQILVPMQLLAKCGTQFPKQSIPRPLSLTFTQVQAHFTIADMQEANLHLGEVQQLYTCNWKNCVRSRCYKKNICGHLVKHIFFTLISKEDYQAMAQTMSTYSPATEETVVKKLKIVAVNKAGEKVSMLVAIPLSQTRTPELLKAAIRKSLASDKSIKLPSQVLESIAAKFSCDNATSSPLAPAKDPQNTSTEKQEPAFLTRAEINGLRKKFPKLLEKWKMVDVDQVGESDDTGDDFKEGEENSDWTPMISKVGSLSSREYVMKSRKLVQKRSKIHAQRWRSVLHKKVPVWTAPSKFQKGELKVIERRNSKSHGVSDMKRKGECTESVHETPPNKKEKVENEKISEVDDEAAKYVPEKTVLDHVMTSDSAIDIKEGLEGLKPENKVGGSNSRISMASVAEDMACGRNSAVKDTESELSPNEESSQSTDQADCLSVQEKDDEDLKKPSQAVPLKTKVVLALSSRQISKAFRFMKSHKNKTVKVAGRGYGYGVFHCSMPQCCFFKEVMTKDKKADIVRTLAKHLQNVHIKNRPHRTTVLQPGSKEDHSYPKKQILQHLKNLSSYQDFKKFKLKNMFQSRRMHRTRLLQVSGYRVRLKVNHFHSCLSRKCFFGCYNASRHVLITHLQSHLRHLQLSGQKTEGSQQVEEPRTLLDDSLPKEDLSSSHQSQVQEQEGQLPALPEATPETSEDSHSQSNDGMQDWEESTEGLTDQCPTRDSMSPMDQGMDASVVSGPTDAVVDEQMATVGDVGDDGHGDSPMEDVDMVDVGDSFDGGNDGIGASGACRETEDDNTNEMKENGTCSESLPTSPWSSGDAAEAGDAMEKDSENSSDCLQDQAAVVKDSGDGVVLSVSSQTASGEKEAPREVGTASDASSPLTPSHSTPASIDMDELLDKPGDSIQMFYDELQSYFSCYTTEMKGKKGFGMKMFFCPKCKKMDLRGENLPDHLETHISKKVLITPVDNIVIHDDNGQTSEETISHTTEMPEVSKNCNETDNTQTPQDNTNPCVLDDKPNSKVLEDENAVYITEEEILHSFFSKDLSVNPDTQFPFGREYLRCNQCSFRTLTILDTPKHIGMHIKKTVILKK